MAENWLDDVERWKWNWTELCGHRGGINPLNSRTHDLGVCFQQVCLQIPVLALIAIISAYHCGKTSTFSSLQQHVYHAINIRILITISLVILPIIRAYIILTNTFIPLAHSEAQDYTTPVPRELDGSIYRNINSLENEIDIISRIRDGLNHTLKFAESILSPESGVKDTTTPVALYNNNYESNITDKATSAKPVDYLVAGTEGLAWVVHLCFILSLKRGRTFNPRGPVLMRALIFLLIVVSALLLHSHVNNKCEDDVLPNLSLGFSITSITLLILYTITLIPGPSSLERTRASSRNATVGERTALLSSSTSSYVQFPGEHDPSYLGVAMEDTTVVSKLLFHWVTPLMERGVKGLLNHFDDLFDLPDQISTSTISYKIDQYLHNMPKTVNNEIENNSEIPLHSNVKVVTSTRKVTLFYLLHKCFGWEFYAVGILKFIADCSSFMGPILLNKLIGFIEDRNEPISHGYLYASLIILSAIIGAFCNTHFTFWMSVVGLKVRSAVITLVYRKTLHSSNIDLNQNFNFGEIVNFMSTDSDRLVNSCPSFHTFWSIPLQLFVTLYLLHQQIGVSFLAGVAFSIVLIPINKIIANKIGKLSTKLMEYKDQRVRLMGEILRGITTIKVNVWEEHFLRNVYQIRENEVKYLRGRKYLDALCVYFWATTPVIIAILTFATYVLLGNELNAKTVFTSMALLNMLIGPLNAFPWVLNGLTEAWVSVKRIQRMLDLPDMDASLYYTDITPDVDLLLQNVTLTVNRPRNNDITTNASPKIATPSSSIDIKKSVSFEDDDVFALYNINLSIKKGQLIGIMGKIGSGKSLLLDGILAEITKTSGIIAVNDDHKGFGYVKQNPWLQRGTIRDNILFGKSYDHNKYKHILNACALTSDLNSLPNKDLTAVGEAGNTLSGGQKTRISLARAIYADKDIYLLDDILATLDVRVAQHVFQHVILGLLRNKTRILCTHQTQYLVHADLVIEMSKGKIVNQGKPSDVLPDLEDYLLSSDFIETNMDVTSIRALPSEFNQSEKDETDPLLNNEATEKGTVHFSVYTCYIKAIGRYLAISIFLSMILMQSSKNITDLWLSYWVTHANATANSTEMSRLGKLQLYYDDYDFHDTKYYLTVYSLLAVFNSIFTLIRAFIFAYGGLQAAVTMHKQLLKIVMRARTIFFDIQPIGRIINRFSSDTYTIDDSLPFISNILLAHLFGLVATVIVTAYGLPWIFLVLAPLVPVYHWIQNHYRLTSREVKRLSSITLSPLYAHFNETLSGLTSIRAFRTVPRFKQENELLLEASQKTQFASIAAGQWLALRLQLIGVALLAGVCIMAVLQHQYNIADPGLIGLAITYALSVTGLLSGVVNSFTETEREMIAVERVKQYLDNVPTENTMGANPPYAWPSQGVVEFREVVLKYRDHLTPSLKEVTFVTRPAEKIGVVGRTGAGKSSLLASLFRLTEINSGSILIDNVNIQTLALKALRSRLAIIPQNPFLFSGTIRENVDPLDQYTDMHIYKALEKCKVHSLVYRLGGLGAILDEGGSNLSAGQRQLFCLVRAVLHNAKIVCIDEATANVDQETDKFIQATIKSSFQSATVITIAHRIRTIMHCDRVLVMGDGEVLEFDEPNLLIQNADSYFYQLANQEFSDQE